MSIKAMNLVFETDLPGDKKIIMLVLADYADDHGYCFPSQEKVARRATTSVRTLQRKLTELEEEGWLVREHRYDARGKRTSDGYRLGDRLAGSHYTPKSGDYTSAVAATKEPSVRTTSRKKERTREIPLPKDWQPTDEHRQRAGELGVDIDREAELFRLHAEAHGRTAKRWNAAFTTWLIKAGDKGATVTPIRPDLQVVPKSLDEIQAAQREESRLMREHSENVSQFYDEWVKAGRPRPWAGPNRQTS